MEEVSDGTSRDGGSSSAGVTVPGRRPRKDTSLFSLSMLVLIGLMAYVVVFALMLPQGVKRQKRKLAGNLADALGRNACVVWAVRTRVDRLPKKREGGKNRHDAGAAFKIHRAFKRHYSSYVWQQDLHISIISI